MTMMHFVSTLSIGTCTSRGFSPFYWMRENSPLYTLSFLDAVNVTGEGARHPIMPNSEFIFCLLHWPPSTLTLIPFSSIFMSGTSQNFSPPPFFGGDRDRSIGFHEKRFCFSFICSLLYWRDNIFQAARVLCVKMSKFPYKRIRENPVP